MRLAPRLFISFGLLATLSTAGLGLIVREDRRKSEEVRFRHEVDSACNRVASEVRRQADSDQKLVSGACQAGELVDETLVAIEADELAMSRASLGQRIPHARTAFDLDALMLVTGDGEMLGVDPRALLSMPTADAKAALEASPDRFLDVKKPAIVSRCVRKAARGSVGLVGRRDLDPLLARLGKTLEVDVARGTPTGRSGFAEAPCSVGDGASVVPLVASKSTQQLEDTLGTIDEKVLLAFGLSASAAILLAMLFARTLGRPIADLAREAQKVATGQARPIEVRGSGEIAELGRTFDKMIEDLAATRRRLAATTRVAAWREVARRVAHEVKNPLAPIRTAVETLRRLRSRQDPAFDEYFDEATRTVLEEVHRISNIVTEFTRFARLPPPRPQEIDLVDVARGVVKLHDGGLVRVGQNQVKLDAREKTVMVRADKDQIIQILTNLVQNSLDAVKDMKGGEVIVGVTKPDATHGCVLVRDNGPGVSAELAPRLFEPYATTKPHGTGLGLAIAQRIAMEHQGELAYAARPNGGAEFRLVLPVDGPPPVSEMQPPSSE
jgi:signal transduction histidine kinase